MKRSSKLKPEHFLESLIFSDDLQGQLSLQESCNDIILHQGIHLSKVALHKRFNSNSLAFLKAVISRLMTSKINFDIDRDWSHFSSVVIADSCKFRLPEGFMGDYPAMGRFGGGKPMMNIQYALDLKNGNWENLELTKVNQNDQEYCRRTLDRINKGELHIRDLGYISQAYLFHVIDQQAYFLNRLSPVCKPIEIQTGKQISWKERYQRMKKDKQIAFDTRIRIGQGEKAVECRLIAIPVPDSVWRERMRKANELARNRGYTNSEEYKSRARFSLFITNVEKQDLEPQQVAEIYRLRWQIELMFKNWKSLFGINKIKVKRKERMECQLYAKLLWIVMNCRIYRCLDAIITKNSTKHSGSMWKIFKHIRKISHSTRMMFSMKINITEWYKSYIVPVINALLLEPKKGKDAAFQIVNQVFKPLS